MIFNLIERKYSQYLQIIYYISFLFFFFFFFFKFNEIKKIYLHSYYNFKIYIYNMKIIQTIKIIIKLFYNSVNSNSMVE
jgi:hypothetical protein